MSNRLSAKQSPYLLQHQHNPVDWFPWGEEAFARARREQKPIFLSIGYSTCHWCHVMEHESFESQDVADLLNAHFVSIKVDREERPDVDRVYMTFVQATTGSGGWPMSVWLTPDLAPFYGGTYFPPEPAFGRPSFTDVLVEIARAWREEREKIAASAASIAGRLRAIGQSAESGALPTEQALADTARQFTLSFDRRWGGFGEAPKFPRPAELLFLFREYARTGDGEARDMALQTLRAMALGGLRDHIGGGFHRYAVDREWRVPHFEKMLYDQAQLTLAYLEAAQITGEAFYAQVAEDTLQYVRREMTDAAGGFYSAEDADSVPPERAAETEARKAEGAFYVWSDQEIGDALGAGADIFRLRFGCLPDGNAPADPHGEFAGRNLLYTARGVADIVATTGSTPDEIGTALLDARARLYAVRARRPRPSLDDKVLTAWNGLMIAAFARGARVLAGGSLFGEPGDGDPALAHLRSAEQAATFLREHMWDPSRRVLLRRFRRGHRAIDGYAEDYAYVIFGLLELFQADGDPRWLSWAIELQARQDELFWDDAEGGWFGTTGADPTVLARMKDEYDGAEPAASSIAVLNLLTLAHLTGTSAYDAHVAATLRLFAARLAKSGRAVPMMAAALSTWLATRAQVAVVGAAGDAEAARMREAVARRYLPFAVVVPLGRGRGEAALGTLAPWLGAMIAGAERATAYVCRDFACEAPMTSADALAVSLDALAAE